MPGPFRRQPIRTRRTCPIGYRQSGAHAVAYQRGKQAAAPGVLHTASHTARHRGDEAALYPASATPAYAIPCQLGTAGTAHDRRPAALQARITRGDPMAAPPGVLIPSSVPFVPTSDAV
jgi:hypothetical protein